MSAMLSISSQEVPIEEDVHPGGGQPVRVTKQVSSSSGSVIKRTISLNSKMMYLNRTRSNRAMTLVNVNKRYQSYSKDYSRFLSYTFEKIGLSSKYEKSVTCNPAISKMNELLKEKVVDVKQYIDAVLENDKITIGNNTQLIYAIVVSTVGVYDYSEQSQVSVYNLVKELHETAHQIREQIPRIDTDAMEILIWWFPQYLEAITMVHLISEPDSQTIGDLKTLNQFFFAFLNNVCIVIYLLAGGHILQMGVSSALDILSSPPDSKVVMPELWSKIASEGKSLSTGIMKKLHWAAKEKLEKENGFVHKISFRVFSSSLEGRDTVSSFKEIYQSVPNLISTTIFLFVLHLPEDIRDAVGLTISEIRGKHEQDLKAESTALDKALELSDSIEALLLFMRDQWMHMYGDEEVSTLKRSILLYSCKISSLSHMERFPFGVPEGMDTWRQYIRLSRHACTYFAHALKKQLPVNEVLSSFDFMLVHTRYMRKIEKIEKMESSFFSF